MATIFLILIYLTFISLGLPDALLGSVWPVMRMELGASLDTAGIVFFILSGGTIFSSLLSGWVTGRFGTGKVTAVSVLLTALALLGASATHSVGWLIAMAIPLGLGAGSVDAALNNYVALHYEPRHMSWLHCFWGVGAFIGPLIIGLFLRHGNAWRGAYLCLGAAQFVIACVLFLSLPLWKKYDKPINKNEQNEAQKTGAEDTTTSGPRNVLRIPGVIAALITFFLYCATEYTVGLWGASFLIELRGFQEPAAASAIAMYYGGITIGRFFSGFLTMRFTGTQLIRAGLCVIVVGAALLLAPLPGAVSLGALLLIGLGCSPIYPSMIHLTPERFGAENSAKIIGLQMATAYTGSTFMPPVIGFIAARTNMLIVPVALLLYAACMLVMSEQITRRSKKR
jgi:fucose permease